MTKAELRQIVKEKLPVIVIAVNEVLHGQSLTTLQPTLQRLGRGGKIPHWFEELSSKGTLSALDGKSIGSVIEMLLIGVLETKILRPYKIPALHINPARGIDLPDLDLGIKSPSKNYCTSEPLFSAYERLNGSEYDALVFITDYQIAKLTRPLKLQIIDSQYVTKSQLADKTLCRIAKKHRESLLLDINNEGRAQRLFRFLAYVNQSEWLGSKLVGIIDHMDEPDTVRNLIKAAGQDFIKTNAKRADVGKQLIPDSSVEALQSILTGSPLLSAILDASENWVAANFQEASRFPSANEWSLLKAGPLDGKIGMSPALQWRYNFGPLFGRNVNKDCKPAV